MSIKPEDIEGEFAQFYLMRQWMSLSPQEQHEFRSNMLWLHYLHIIATTPTNYECPLLKKWR